MQRELEDWDRLGQTLRDWREEVGLTQAAIQAAGGPSTAKLRELERGEGEGTEDRTKRRLERALGWELGSVDRILAGGHPRPLVVPQISRPGQVPVEDPEDEGADDESYDVSAVLIRIPEGTPESVRQGGLRVAGQAAQSAFDQYAASRAPGASQGGR